MSEAEDITEAYREAFDEERALRWGNAQLVLVLNAGTEDESELEIEGGWLPKKQRKFGEVNSIYLIQVTARDGLTLEIMNQADRLKLKGVVYDFNFDPPGEAPEIWELYATERKAGGLR